jgi:DNA-binding XRE family transcriptional regulator
MKPPLVSVTPIKRPYRRGFTLRRVPRLTSTKASRSEMEFFAKMIDALRAKRCELGLSQEATSQIVGVSEGMVAKWETGHKMPNSFWLMCWCQALGVEVRLA